MAAPERPDPPIVGKVTHNTIELYWDSAANITEHVGLPNTRTDGRKHFVVQEEETGLNRRAYGTVYSGFACKNVFEGLEPKTTYRYRLRATNDFGQSPWSAPVEVSTTKKPASSEDLNKAVSRNDVEVVNHLLTGIFNAFFGRLDQKSIFVSVPRPRRCNFNRVICENENTTL